MFSAKIRLLFIFMIILNIFINTTHGVRLNPGFSNTEVDWINLQEYSNEYSYVNALSRTNEKNNVKHEIKRGFVRRTLHYSVMLYLIIFF